MRNGFTGLMIVSDIIQNSKGKSQN